MPGLGNSGFNSVMSEKVGDLGSSVVPSLDSESAKTEFISKACGSFVINGSDHFGILLLKL